MNVTIESGASVPAPAEASGGASGTKCVDGLRHQYIQLADAKATQIRIFCAGCGDVRKIEE